LITIFSSCFKIHGTLKNKPEWVFNAQKNRNILALLFLLICQHGVAQNRFVDSLYNALKTTKDDTNKINTLNLLSEKLWRKGQYDTAITCANQALKLAKDLEFKKGMAGSYHN
jgi:hypothetical protein